MTLISVWSQKGAGTERKPQIKSYASGLKNLRQSMFVQLHIRGENDVLDLGRAGKRSKRMPDMR